MPIHRDIDSVDVDSDDDFEVTNRRADRARFAVRMFNVRIEENIINSDYIGSGNHGLRFEKMSTSNSFPALYMFGKEEVGIGGTRCSKRIPVQPTGITRRAVGKPRGPNALLKGTPLVS